MQLFPKTTKSPNWTNLAQPYLTNLLLNSMNEPMNSMRLMNLIMLWNLTEQMNLKKLQNWTEPRNLILPQNLMKLRNLKTLMMTT